MASLLTPAMFIGTRNIPNRGSVEVAEKIQSFIDLYENEIFINIFSREFLDLFRAGVTATEPRWIAFKDGVIYTDDLDKSAFFAGALQIALDYVYYKYMADAATQSTGIAIVIKKSEMAINTSPMDKMIDCWNRMSRNVRVMYNMLLSDYGILTYSEFNEEFFWCGNYFTKPINAFFI